MSLLSNAKKNLSFDASIWKSTVRDGLRHNVKMKTYIEILGLRCVVGEVFLLNFECRKDWSREEYFHIVGLMIHIYI